MTQLIYTWTIPLNKLKTPLQSAYNDQDTVFGTECFCELIMLVYMGCRFGRKEKRCFQTFCCLGRRTSGKS